MISTASCPQTAKDASKRLVNALKGHQVLLSGPSSPDADSIGGCFAFARIMSHYGVDCAVAGEFSSRYNFLEGVQSRLSEEQVRRQQFTAVVILDGDRHRLSPAVQEAFESAEIQGIIDHHQSTQPAEYTHCWLEPEAASATLMLARAVSRWKLPLTQKLAECLYMGLVFDTGGFQHNNTSAEVHRLSATLIETGFDHVRCYNRVLRWWREPAMRAFAEIYKETELLFEGQLALGIVPLELQRRLGVRRDDLEGLVENLASIDGVQIAILVTEQAPERVKLSLRSRGATDVAHLALEFTPTGGGHKNAAGAVCRYSMSEALHRIQTAVGAILKKETNI